MCSYGGTRKSQLVFWLVQLLYGCFLNGLITTSWLLFASLWFLVCWLSLCGQMRQDFWTGDWKLDVYAFVFHWLWCSFWFSVPVHSVIEFHALADHRPTFLALFFPRNYLSILPLRLVLRLTELSVISKILLVKEIWNTSLWYANIFHVLVLQFCCISKCP